MPLKSSSDKKIHYDYSLRGLDTLGRFSDVQGRLNDFRFTFLKPSPSEKRSAIKGNNQPPGRANSFLLE